MPTARLKYSACGLIPYPAVSNSGRHAGVDVSNSADSISSGRWIP